MKKVDDDFQLVDLPIEAQDPEISKDDFVLQDSDSAIHEQRFQTKPTTFFKDSMRRFAKNKSSVVAAVILGVLIALSLVIPVVSPYDVSKPQDAALSNLEPKLFDNANGFWDGTNKLTHIAVDEATGLPDAETYPLTGIIGGEQGIVIGEPEVVKVADKHGFGGYVLAGYYGGNGLSSATLTSTNPFDYIKDLKEKKFKLNLANTTLTLQSFETVDLAKIQEYEHDTTIGLPEGYALGKVSLEFNYYNKTTKKYTAVPLVSPASVHNVTNLELNSLITAVSGTTTEFDNFYFTVRVTPVEGTPASANVCGLVRSLMIHTSLADIPFTPTDEEPTNPNQNEIDYFSTELGNDLHGICFDNPMSFVARKIEVGYGAGTKQNRGYWSIGAASNYSKEIYLGKCRFCSFTFDSYAATLGETAQVLSLSELKTYRKRGYITLSYSIDYDEEKLESFSVTIKNKAKCPIVNNLTIDDVASFKLVLGKENISVNAKVIKWKYLGFPSMPKYLFGTDKAGRDMLKYVFEGLRNSLLLGVLTFAVCFLFGLLWGAISGYFGGNVDLVMERFTDILSGMPWIVVMTIIVMHLGRNFLSFAIALCLTGWIGTASTTRTQFYRFRGREYVLASRTLGASDARLIAKHILPNAMGTIITGAVLMIPSVIFSEATLAYLGLGFLDRSSLGVILSDNQAQLFNYPYQLIFPSVIISLLMISFNLFGNGLRDAINPSLKGEGE